MSKSIIQSFSYDITEAATITLAEDKAKQEGKSFSKYLLRLIKEDVDEQKKVEALARLPILNGIVDRQTTITEYDIKLFEPHQERINKIKNLSKDQQTKLAADIIHLQQEIRLVRKY